MASVITSMFLKAQRLLRVLIMLLAVCMVSVRCLSRSGSLAVCSCFLSTVFKHFRVTDVACGPDIILNKSHI